MHKQKKYLISIVFILFAFMSFSQEVKFFEAPENFQLYARDKSDSATVSVRGEFGKNTKYDEIVLKVFKDDVLFDTHESNIQKQKFRVKSRINAGLHNFRFELHLIKGAQDSLIALADSVVCGDTYIITGQSNSHASSSLSIFSCSFCRSFGVKTGYETYTEDDKKVRWGRASGNCPGLKGIGGWFTKNPFGVGAWGMELARLIVEKHKIPICIINGGSGSSSIEENMLYPEKPSLETNFGRLAYRVDQAGLKDNIKAIFWHQGETNSDERYKTYAKSFDILLKDWKRVYTGLDKIYLFQLHPGCGGNYQSEMREIQHQIANRYDDVDIMSTTGVVGHDGCHFSYEGYCEFARRILPLVSRDFYGEKTDKTITPPSLLKVFYKNQNEIVLLFDQSVTFEEKINVKGQTHFLKDQFFFNNTSNEKRVNGVVKEMKVEGNEIILTLEPQSKFNFVTYLPNVYYPETRDTYEGPWVQGSENNLGVLSFDHRKIELSPNLWNGFALLDSTLNGVSFKVVFPKTPNKNHNWIWRARFWGHKPQTDLALLEQGFHLVYIEVGGLFGNEKAVNIWDNFYAFATQKYQLNNKVVLEGMSRGGLIIFNWGNRNAEKVACIYGDAPVCDFKSWPGGKGAGLGSPANWSACLEQYGFTEQIALNFNGNPIDHMENIARYKVPILNVLGDADHVVPLAENTALLEKRLNLLGWEMEIIHKPGVGHHPHSLKDPKPIVDFILKNTGNL